jgi:hypothetical protein
VLLFLVGYKTSPSRPPITRSVRMVELERLEAVASDRDNGILIL